MPLVNGQYVAPTWVNDNPPAINAAELNAMSGAIAGAVEFDRNQNLTSSQKSNARNNIGCPSIIVENKALLSSGWSGSSAPYTYTITDANITTSSAYVDFRLYGGDASVFAMYESAKIILSSVTQGSFTVSAMGVKPTSIITIQYVVLQS